MALPGEVDGKKFLRAMARLGWHVERQRGSHRKLVNASGAMMIVAFHKSLSRVSVRRTLRQAGISEEEFVAQL